jgi:hypothetical protein
MIQNEEVAAVHQQVQECSGWLDVIYAEIHKRIVGQTYLIERLLVGLLGGCVQVAHLAAGPRTAFSVAMQLHVAVRERFFPLRFAALPELAEQVGHRRRPQQRRVAEWQATDGTQVLLDVARAKNVTK